MRAHAHRYTFLACLSVAALPLPVLAQAAPAAQVIMPILPATTLPPVTVPATPVSALPPVPAQPATALPPTPATAATVTANTALTVLDETKPVRSMGNSKVSVFFTPLQIRAMQDALQEYESRPPGKATEANLEIDLQKKEAPKLVEPDIYPVFYLSSIVYHGPKDWSIWVSGHKITSAKNGTDLTVLSVSESQASFSWKPTFNKALVTRKASNSFAPVDAIKNKLTKTSRMTYNPEAGVFNFTLGTNQTFSVAYMNTFEGFVASPKLPALPVEAAKTETSDPIGEPIAPSASTPTPPNQPVILGTRPLSELIKRDQTK